MNNNLLPIIMVLLSAFMWGSWGQFIKRVSGWNIRMFMFMLYLFSIILTWVILLIFCGIDGYIELLNLIYIHPQFLLYPILGGIIYTLGMWFNIVAVDIAGLSITYIIFTSISMLLGTSLSIIAGGLPEGTSIFSVLIGAILILISVFFCGYSSNSKEKNSVSNNKNGVSIKTILLYGVISGFFVSSFPFFMTLSIKTSINPNGLNSYQYMALLSCGSMITAILVCLIPLIKSKELIKAFNVPKSYFVFAALSAIMHYGGNILNAVYAPLVGLALSWPLGQTMALWAVLWGVIYKEYNNAPMKSILSIILAIIFIILGTLYITLTVYN